MAERASIEIQLKNANKLVRDLERATNEVKDLESALRKLGNVKAAAKIRKLGQSAEKASGRFKGFLGSLRAVRGGLLALGIGAVIRKMSQLVSEAVRIKNTFDGIEQTLLAVTDSNAEYNRAQELVLNTARRLGQQITSLGTDYAQFLASTKELDLSQKQIEKIFIQVAEAARVLNLPVERVKLTFLALSQVASKGIATMEELRRQLGDQLPGILPRLAKELGITTAALFELIRSGKLLAEEVLPAIGDAAEKLAGGQVQEASQTLAANLERMRLEAQLAQKAIIDLSEPALKAAAQRMAELARTSIEAQEALAGITATGVETASFLATLSVNLLEAGSIITTVLKGVLDVAPHRLAVEAIGNVIEAQIGFKIAVEETALAVEALTKLQIIQGKTLRVVVKEAKEAAEAERKITKDREKIANINADALAKIAVKLGKDLRRISKESAEQIENIEKLSAKEREDILKALAVALVRVEIESAEERAAAADFIITIGRGTADRRLQVNQALQQRLAAIELEVVSDFKAAAAELLAGAQVSAKDREKLAEEINEKLLRIEQDRFEKIEAARRAFEEKLLEGDNREEVEKELSDKVIKIFEDETKKKINLLESFTDKVEASVEKQINLDKKLLAQRLKSLTKLKEEARKVFKELEEISFGTGGDEAVSKVRDLKKELSGLKGRSITTLSSEERKRLQDLPRLIGAAGEALQKVGTDAQILSAGFDNLGIAQSLFSKKALEDIRGLIVGNKDFARSFESLSEFQKTALEGALGNFELLAEKGRLTDADVRSLNETFKALGVAGPEAVGSIATALDRLTGALTPAQEIATGLTNIGEKATAAEPLVAALAGKIAEVGNEETAAKIAGIAGSFATLSSSLGENSAGFEQIKVLSEALKGMVAPLDSIVASLPLLPEPVKSIVASAIALFDAGVLVPISEGLTAINTAAEPLVQSLPIIAEGTEKFVAAAEAAPEPLGALQEALEAIGSKELIAGLEGTATHLGNLLVALEKVASDKEGFAKVTKAAQELVKFLENEMAAALLALQKSLAQTGTDVRELGTDINNTTESGRELAEVLGTKLPEASRDGVNSAIADLVRLDSQLQATTQRALELVAALNAAKQAAK